MGLDEGAVKLRAAAPASVSKPAEARLAGIFIALANGVNNETIMATLAPPITVSPGHGSDERSNSRRPIPASAECAHRPIRCRAAFFALAVGGWLAAAITAAGTVLATRITTPSSTVPALAAYRPGYYVFLGAAAVIALAGLWSAIAGDRLTLTQREALRSGP